MAPTPRGWGALVALLCLALGCNNNGQAPAQGAALAECRQALDKVRTQTQGLLEQLSLSQTRAAELQSQVDERRIENTELALWAQQVAERFGPSVWFVGPDEKPLPYKSMPSASPRRLLAQLNDLFQQSHQPQATLQKIEADTAFIHIAEERRLTQEMGTTGATAYLQAVIYTLTSVPSIKYVAFDFEPGDHAMPGRYSR